MLKCLRSLTQTSRVLVLVAWNQGKQSHGKMSAHWQVKTRSGSLGAKDDKMGNKYKKKVNHCQHIIHQGKHLLYFTTFLLIGNCCSSDLSLSNYTVGKMGWRWSHDCNIHYFCHILSTFSHQSNNFYFFFAYQPPLVDLLVPFLFCSAIFSYIICFLQMFQFKQSLNNSFRIMPIIM